MDPIDSLIWTVPYWTRFATPLGAAGGGRVVTGDGLLYRFDLYDGSGRLIRTFGTAPPSWRAPGRPQPGEFTGVDGFKRMRQWLDVMTEISAVGVYVDSAIFVVEAHPEPTSRGYDAHRDALLDIYSLEGKKLWQGVPLPPGRVLRVEDYLYVLVGEPPAPWTVAIYRLRGPGKR